MSKSVPSIFVSSTCYDLKKVRKDIKNFIESLNYEPLLSEFDSFPINPDLGTVENCLKIVKEKADIFVLIVGGRYGYITEQGKSITNLEYIQAKARGIPIYVFIKKSILDFLPAWINNPDIDLHEIVDSAKQLEFVHSVISSQEIWVFPFELTDDVLKILRNQLAYLFNDALHLRNRAREHGLADSFLGLNGLSLRLLIERPSGWEYLLLSQVLQDELAKTKPLKRDFEYDIVFGSGEELNPIDFVKWTQIKINQLSSNAEAVNQILGKMLGDALGPPGIPGNPELIIYAAQKLVESYKQAINWSLEIRKVHVDDKWKNLIRIISRFPTNMIQEIEDYSNRIYKETREALKVPVKEGETRTIKFVLRLTISGIDEYEREIKKIKKFI